MKLPYEKGVAEQSLFFELTPSSRAIAILYYLQRMGHFYCSPDYQVKRQFYPGYLLAYVLNGELFVENGNLQARVGKGGMAFLNCHLPHRYFAVGELEYIWLHFDGANTAAFYSEMISCGSLIPPVFTHELEPDPRILILKNILQELRDNGRIEENNISCILHRLLCHMFYPVNSRDQLPGVILKAQDFMANNLQTDLSVIEIARHCHLSASQLNRLFRQSIGQTVHEYLMNLRFTKAKSLLKETSLQIEAISNEIGYRHVAGFSKAFKAKTGLSPSVFRKSAL